MAIQKGLFGNDIKLQQKTNRPSLASRFIVPPFSTFDTRQPYWIKRKKLWRKLGIESELGRDKDMYIYKSTINDLYRDGHKNAESVESNVRISIFDPVLCEIMYTWFCPKNGKILDPFAGGSVRGIVANKIGYHYTGIDLSTKQIQANIEQALKIVPDNIPTWIIGDSQRLDSLVSEKFDFVFSCPPYYNLETYSDNENDLSNMPMYDTFLTSYELIIKKSIDALKQDSFACFVVGDIRDKDGIYRGLVCDTIRAFTKAGASYYNHGIMLTSLASLPVRVSRQFNFSRKLGKAHQDVLIFVKGDSKKATDKLENF